MNEPNPQSQGASYAQRLGASIDSGNPFHPMEEGQAFEAWRTGFNEATVRLTDLFTAWLSLGHSVRSLTLGKAGEALGPMAAGLIHANGNAVGALLVGALVAQEGGSLRDLLSDDVGQTRRNFEATQYAITGHDLPEELEADEFAVTFYRVAKNVGQFREGESEVQETEDGRKFAQVSFDLAGFLKALVVGLPQPESIES